ncbi:MAG TPA: NAD-dependent epimerase/dehydratase family protein [Rugosimonospora sp.]|nr:NAD-dependent epimerase/dehydratase family protein [Rugosimonospora sp.]
MHILLTGGAGFIGARVVEALLADGHRVRVLDALLGSAHSEPPAIPDGVEFIHGDLRDEDTVDAALRGVDLVNHHAAMVGRGKEIREAPNYAGNSDLATAVLIAGMLRRDVGRLVLAGSVVVYGDCRYHCAEHGRVRPRRRESSDLDAGRFEPRCPRCGADVTASAATEDDLPDPPRNMYAVTKLAQELLVAAWAVQTGGRAIALRYHNVYGPGMPFASPYSGVASTFRSAVAAGEPPRVYEDGGPLRDFVHLTDVAAANVTALSLPVDGFRAYNVASDTPHTILDLAAALAEAVGGPPPIVTGEYRVGDVRHIFATAARLRAESGWRPTVGFTEGVAEFATAPMRGLAGAVVPR